MALTPEEKQIIQWGKENGKTLTQTKAALARYRKEQRSVTTDKEAEQSGGSFLDKAGGVAKKALSFIGGDQISESIGKGIARGSFGQGLQKSVVGRDLSPEEEALVGKGPGAKEIAGDTLELGSNFFPIGRVASGISKVGKTLGIGSKVGKTTGNIVGGGATGLAADIGNDVSSGREIDLGAETALGFGIPAGTPLAEAFTKASGRFAGRMTSEVQGALTGTSAETIEQAFIASRKGGKDLDEFTKALRQQTTPEALVDTVRSNIEQIATQRQRLFTETLNELGDTSLATAGAKKRFADDLQSAGISISDNGTLDFANSKLRTVPNAQSKLEQAWQEVQKMPDTVTLAELDTTRQAIKGIKSISGDEPSANLANMLIDDAVRATREAGEQVKGYGQMLDNFGETSEFLNELNKGLASGDKSTIDQAYRRMATSLKTNNEQRKVLIEELDQLTDGAILSTISGQQLSETLPRGIFRQIAAGMAGGAVITGGLSPQLLPALVFASPRVTGEFVRSLGLSAAKTEIMIESIGDARTALIKAGVMSVEPEEESAT